MFLIISLRPCKLEICTIPHFKALDLLFWPLAWCLTRRSIVFRVWCKTFVYFFCTPSISLWNLTNFITLVNIINVIMVIVVFFEVVGIFMFQAYQLKQFSKGETFLKKVFVHQQPVSLIILRCSFQLKNLWYLLISL